MIRMAVWMSGTPENVMIDMTQAAPALGLTYTWDDKACAASLTSEENGELPERYDLRENRTLNGVENQGTFWNLLGFRFNRSAGNCFERGSGNGFF